MAVDAKSSNILLKAYGAVASSGMLEHGICKKIFRSSYFAYKRYFEDPFWAFGKRFPFLFADGHIIDVGANVGYTAHVFSRLLKWPYKVFAFEPEIANFSMMLEMIEERQLNEYLVPVRAAVGDHDGVVNLWINEEHHADHRILTEQFLTRVNEDDEVERVELVSLDSFVNSHLRGQPISFVKMDVQGFELAVCQGMNQLINDNPMMSVAFEYAPEHMIQLGYRPQDILEFFAERDFEIYFFGKGKTLKVANEELIEEAIKESSYFDLLASKRQLSPFVRA